MPDEVIIESQTMMNGELIIDHENGVATFKDGWGRTILRVTHLPTPVPLDVGIDLVAIRNVTSYTPLTMRELAPPIGIPRHTESFKEWLDDGIVPVAQHREKSALAEWLERQSGEGMVKFDLPCPICRKAHVSADFTKWGPYTLVKDHEYIIWTRTSQQKYAHRGRMQFLGQGPSDFKYQLTFNARGPDRSTDDQFGGTQMLDARNIVKLEEVERDPSKRYVDETDRDMKRELCLRARTRNGTTTTSTSCGGLHLAALPAEVTECPALEAGVRSRRTSSGAGPG